MTQANAENSTSAPGVSPTAPSINPTLEPFGAIGFQERPIYPPEVADALVVLRKARSDAADQIERLLSFLNETELDIEENEIDAIFRARFGDSLLEDEFEEREPGT